MNKLKKLFGLDAKTIFVNRNIYSYGISCKQISGGSFYITKNKTTSYYNGVMEGKIEQLKYRAKSMSFSSGFWFLKNKAKEFNYNFHYELLA